MAVLGVVLMVYFTGAMEEFWDVGVLYNLDYIRLGRNPGESVNFWFNLGQYGQLWGVFLIFGLVGLANFRLNYFTNSIRLRKVETVTLFWFSAAMLLVMTLQSRRQPSSCDDEVRMIIGQYGHGMSSVRTSGG